MGEYKAAAVCVQYRSFSMGALTVLALPLCLLAFSLGAKASFEWSVSETEEPNEEPNSMERPVMFETGYEAPYQAEAPELGLEVKHQAPEDYDITLMTHRVRRSEKKKKRKTRPGAYSSVGVRASILILDGKKASASTRTKREVAVADNLLSLPNPHHGKMSVMRNVGQPEVVRAKRHLENSQNLPKKRPGKWSLVGRYALPLPNATKSNNEESQE